MAARKRTKKDTTALELVDALCDVVAHRIAAKMLEASKPVETPELVPVWLFGPRPTRNLRKQRARSESSEPLDDEAIAEQCLREAGAIKLGEPGYRDLLTVHLANTRTHDAELHVRAQMRKAARLIEKLVKASNNPR